MTIYLSVPTFLIGDGKLEKTAEIADHEEQISLYIRRDQMSTSLQKIVERNLTTRATGCLSSIGESHQKNNLKLAKHTNLTG